MAINHWLKEFKETKKLLSKCKVCLYHVNSSTLEFYEYQDLSLTPSWDFALVDQATIPMSVDGIAINYLDNGKFVKMLWSKDFTNIVLTHPSNKISVVLNLKIGKWWISKLIN